MENPATWGEAEIIVENVLLKHYALPEDFAGLSLNLKITNALREANLLDDDIRDTLFEALAEADAALGGDSNDAEHEALYSIREIIAGLLGVDTPAPEPEEN